MTRRCAFLLPGDIDTLTGGYLYDRHIVAGLRDAGWQVALHALDASFPWPSAAALAHADAVLSALPDGELVVCDGLAFGALPALAERHAGRLTWVALVHHPLALEHGLPPAQQQALHDSERRALAVAHTVIVTSDSTARALAALQVPASRITVVLPGTDPAPLADPGDDASGLQLLCVATLTPRKGHTVLIEALAALQDRRWTLHCAGSLARDPVTTQAVAQAVAKHGLGEQVLLHGELGEPALAALYARAHVAVLPSFHEGYGMSLAEALAHGLPVVSTTAGAIPDTVPPSAGALVPPGDVPALRAALARVMDDPAWRQSLAHGARAARTHLPTWPLACQRFSHALRRTLDTLP